MRPMAPSTGDYHHHINPRCIDAARCARGLADGVHPRSEGRPLQPSIEAKAECRVELRVELRVDIAVEIAFEIRVYCLLI